METICASRDMSTASFCKLDLREKELVRWMREDGGRRDEHVGGWDAGRSRAVARDVLRLAQPRDVRGDGGSTARVKAVVSTEIEPAACRIEQQRLVFWIEQGRVSRVRVQSYDYRQRSENEKESKMRVGCVCVLGGGGRRSPLSSAPSSHSASHFPRSSGMPHSASTTMGSNASFVAASRNSGRV